MLSNKVLIIGTSIITGLAIGLSSTWFLKSEKLTIQKNNTLLNTQPIPTVTANIKETQFANTQVSQENVIYSIRKVADISNVVEVATYKNRNSLLYLEKTPENYKLYGADVNESGQLSESKLLDSNSIAKNKQGLWDIQTGYTFDSSIYFSDNNNKVELIFNDITSPDSEPLTSIPENYTSNIILGGLDNKLIYARNNNTTSEIEIVAQELKAPQVEILYSAKSYIYDNTSSINWIDISSDHTKLLYSLKDPLTKNYVIWLVDLNNKIPIKLSNDDQNVSSCKFSRAGNKVVYASEDSNNYSNIFYCNLENLKTSQITFGNNHFYSPDWLFYGEQIIFIQEDQDHGNCLNIVDLNKG